MRGLAAPTSRQRGESVDLLALCVDLLDSRHRAAPHWIPTINALTLNPLVLKLNPRR